MTSTDAQYLDAASKARSSHIGGVLMLSGGLKLPPLADGLRIPLLCLPRNTTQSILDRWVDSFQRIGIGPDITHVLVDGERSSRWDALPHRAPIFCDVAPYRGPAGVVRDASAAIEVGAACLLVEHTRLPQDADLLIGLAAAHRPGGRAITVCVNPDESYAGIILADREAIDLIPTIGFMDIKEQWLPAAYTNGFSITTHQLTGWSRPIRTRGSYIDALDRFGVFRGERHTEIVGSGGSVLDPISYDAPLVCQGATIHPSAAVARSVIGPHATIGAGATVARSVVVAGAVVPPNTVVVDSVYDSVGRGERRLDTGKQ